MHNYAPDQMIISCFEVIERTNTLPCKLILLEIYGDATVDGSAFPPGYINPPPPAFLDGYGGYE
jgi:hypothetical protein